MTLNRILKQLLNIKGAVVDNAEFATDATGRMTLKVHVHVARGHRSRCPVCGEKCHVYDHQCEANVWRSMDFGPVSVCLLASVPRISCPAHGVLTASVPWAKSGTRFTTDFAYSAAWMLKGGLNKTKISQWLQIDWKTAGRLVKLVWNDLEPDAKKRLDGLVNIGIDETSHRKGHTYITVIVNHDTNTVVWAHDGHGGEVLELFFADLTEEQRASIRVVAGDGARWITECVEACCPNADRCVDPFHVVGWANDAVDAVRLDAWRRARIELADFMKKAKPGKKSGSVDPESAERIKALGKDVEMLRRSKHPLGKNPENLTAKQNERLMMIQAKDRRLRRAHELKEELRLVFKLTTHDAAREYLGKWVRSAQHCRTPAFVELQRKIRRHEKHILNTIEFGLSNARIEATNNKIKLLIRIAYGFRDIDTMIGLIMLLCSSIEIPWPGRGKKTPVK